MESPLLDLNRRVVLSERDPNNPLFRRVGENYLKGRLRSHPDVARRRHADLIAPDASAVPSSGC